jgi:predicted ATPase
MYSKGLQNTLNMEKLRVSELNTAGCRHLLYKSLELPTWCDMARLDRIEIEGYKSIQKMELSLNALNIFIGANGAGKSNFISFFQLLNSIMEKSLQFYVGKKAGADSLLHFGVKHTKKISAKLNFGMNGYFIELEPSVSGGLVFGKEEFFFDGIYGPTSRTSRGHSETLADEFLKQTGTTRSIAQHVVAALSSWKLYHFHDTSDSAPVKQSCQLNDNASLRRDASNLPAFLYLLKMMSEKEYENIRQAIQLVAPSFDDFMLRPNPLDPGTIQLEWREKNSDYPFRAHHLSDGTLRFICLATLLLQPSPPSMILIDEPELGLHPYAITVLASMLKAASERVQVLLSTQSISLLNEFQPEDIVVVDKHDGASVFKRPDVPSLTSWLEDYSLGELWEKNIIGGRPAR